MGRKSCALTDLRILLDIKPTTINRLSSMRMFFEKHTDEILAALELAERAENAGAQTVMRLTHNGREFSVPGWIGPTVRAALELAGRVATAPRGVCNAGEAGFYVIAKDEPNAIHVKLKDRRVYLVPADDASSGGGA